MLIIQVIVFALGLLIVVSTLLSAVKTVVLPRGANVILTRMVFIGVNFLFRFRTRKAKTYEELDGLMAMFAPLALLCLPIVWVVSVALGYTLMYWGAGVQSVEKAILLSGSTVFTLGIEPPPDFFTTILAYSEALLGLGIIALLIGYLPTIYGIFSRREALVSMLEVRAGSPPSAVEMISRAHRIHGLAYLTDLWRQWEVWFVEVEESHTSLASVNFFRSPQGQRSWITAAGAILDGAALVTSAVDIPQTPQAQLCIRAGYLCLRHIADFFYIPYDPAPKPTDPISITREEFDEAYDQLKQTGVPMREDREKAWHDFVGWRVNYDTVLLALAALLIAPYAPWSSDRSLQRRRPQFSVWGGGKRRT